MDFSFFDSDSLSSALERVKNVAQHLNDKAVELNQQKDTLVAQKTAELRDALAKVVESAHDKMDKLRSKRDVQDVQKDDVQDRVSHAKSALQSLKQVLAAKTKDVTVASGLKSLDVVDGVLDIIEKKLVPEARDQVARFGDKMDARVRQEKQKLVDFLDFLEQKYFDLRQKSEQFTNNLFDRKQQVLHHLRKLIQNVRARLQRANNSRSRRSLGGVPFGALENLWEAIRSQFQKLEHENASPSTTIKY